MSKSSYHPIFAFFFDLVYHILGWSLDCLMQCELLKKNKQTKNRGGKKKRNETEKPLQLQKKNKKTKSQLYLNRRSGGEVEEQ